MNEKNKKGVRGERKKMLKKLSLTFYVPLAERLALRNNPDYDRLCVWEYMPKFSQQRQLFLKEKKIVSGCWKFCPRGQNRPENRL